MELMLGVDGGEVWVQDTGGDGTPVVLLHPGWGDAGIWDAVVERLSGSARLIRYDCRGYRNSPAPTAPFTALGDLLAVLDGLGVARAVLVGHSGGGATAAGLALARPERVSSLILVAPGIAGYPWPPDDPFGIEIGTLAQAEDLDGIAELGLRTWARAGADPAVAAQIRASVPGMAAQAPFLRPDPDSFARLTELTAPTSLLIGELEYPMVADCAAAAAARIPGCRVITLPGVDHMVPLRAPERIAALITEALASEGNAHGL